MNALPPQLVWAASGLGRIWSGPIPLWADPALLLLTDNAALAGRFLTGDLEPVMDSSVCDVESITGSNHSFSLLTYVSVCSARVTRSGLPERQA